MQGETAAEIAGLAKAMLDVCVPVDAGPDGVLMYCCPACDAAGRSVHA